MAEFANSPNTVGQNGPNLCPSSSSRHGDGTFPLAHRFLRLFGWEFGAWGKESCHANDLLDGLLCCCCSCNGTRVLAVVLVVVVLLLEQDPAGTSATARFVCALVCELDVPLLVCL